MHLVLTGKTAEQVCERCEVEVDVLGKIESIMLKWLAMWSEYRVRD